VQLRADVIAHKVIVNSLSAAFPKYRIVSEESSDTGWPDEEFIWVVDPLDGTNNFGYGIAHCAIAITLFRGDEVVVALVFDPLLGREFCATEHEPMPRLSCTDVSLNRATISLVTNYSSEGRAWGTRMGDRLGDHCKRILSLWAPALDLALIADGELDAMVCHRGYPLDLCGGLFLVNSAGGVTLDMSGRPLQFSRSTHAAPMSFVAARTPELAAELLACITDL
jgi:myo-inositol-1(or 4)-monophosphatase